MQSYITKPKSVRRSELINRKTLSIGDLSIFKNNSNTSVLANLLQKSFINSNIDSKCYIKKSNFFLLTNKAINSNSIILNEDDLQCVSPIGYETKNSCECKYMDILIGNNGSLGNCLILKTNKNIITNSNLTLLRFKNDINVYYYLGLFYTEWFKQYCSVISSKSGTQEFITRSAL